MSEWYLWFRSGWCAHIDLWFVYFVSACVWRAYYIYMYIHVHVRAVVIVMFNTAASQLLFAKCSAYSRPVLLLFVPSDKRSVRSVILYTCSLVCFGDDHQFSYCRLISFIFTNTICDTNRVIDKIHIDYFENNKYYGIYSGFEIRKSCIITNDFEKIEYKSRDKAFLVVWKKLCVTVGRPIIKIYCLVPTNWKILFQARIEVA